MSTSDKIDNCRKQTLFLKLMSLAMDQIILCIIHQKKNINSRLTMLLIPTCAY